MVIEKSRALKARQPHRLGFRLYGWLARFQCLVSYYTNTLGGAQGWWLSGPLVLLQSSANPRYPIRIIPIRTNSTHH
jgi:hypothetical protein